MSTYPIIVIAIGLTIVLFLAIAVIIYRRTGQTPKTDYRTFFIVGVTWLPLGIATDNPGLWGLGIVFLIAGLVNKDKWKKA